jgi:hypothetical protein
VFALPLPIIGRLVLFYYSGPCLLLMWLNNFPASYIDIRTRHCSLISFLTDTVYNISEISYSLHELQLSILCLL